MGMRRELDRLVAGCLCWALMLPFLPRRVEAARPKAWEIVIVEAGQPAVWSLGQAHYLLANMHKRNLDLSTRLPSEDDLDPNRINASRLEALRTALRLEAQFDESIGVKNDLERNRFRNEQARLEQAREALTDRRQDLAVLDSELLTLNEELVTLQEQDRQSAERRAATTPPTPPSDSDNSRKLRIEVLKVRKAQKDVERTRLESEIASLNTAATSNPTAPAFQTVSLGGRGELPASDTFKTFMENAVKQFERPTVAPSLALDNFIGMQYEIISKQLTLLRDEVGPDERVIFLELPSSIYTVADKADGYIAQVEWEVTRYFDKLPSKRIRDRVQCLDLKRQGKACPGERALEGERPLERGRRDSSDNDVALLNQDYPVTLEMVQMAASQAKAFKSIPSELSSLDVEDMDGAEGKRVGAMSEFNNIQVRALDIIPRQSTLNINEQQAAVRYFGFLGTLKWLSGIGAAVDFQRQRELYQQFLRQEIFASGYGKGSNKFGWTFGPLPGSRRLAPGQRTTFAVLAVPRNTLALELTPRARAFKRNQRPGNEIIHPSLMVGVPGAHTDGFWIEEVSYAPVTKGRRATVLLEGLHFSPQLGVLVNGTPLKKVVSITRAGSKELPAVSASGIDGEYELTNSRQIVLSFGMGSDYVGTPMLTLVTPDKSASINFFGLTINRRPGKSLQEISRFEPMFIDEMNVTAELEEIDRFAVGGAEFVAARISGHGLRPSALIAVNNHVLHRLDFGTRMTDIERRFGSPNQFYAQESTGAYVVYFKRPGDKVTIRYQQPTRQGFEEAKIVHVLNVSFDHKIRHYRRGFRGQPAEVDLMFTSKGAVVQAVSLSNGLENQKPKAPRRCLPPQREGTSDNYRVHCTIPPLAGNVERDFVPVEVQTTAGVQLVDLSLPVRPAIATVTNPRTGNGSGFANEEPVVVISGVNLQNVTTVFFGELAVKVTVPGEVDSIAVKVPKVESIPPGQSIVVAVLFQTSTDGDARIPSGAFYTYFEPPLEPNVVAYPCSPVAPCCLAVGQKP